MRPYVKVIDIGHQIGCRMGDRICEVIPESELQEQIDMLYHEIG